MSANQVKNTRRMIDATYGHLAPGAEANVVALMDAHIAAVPVNSGR